MKFKLNKRFAKLCAYVAVTCMSVYLFTVLVDYAPNILDSTLNIFNDILNLLSPIIVALVICYLLYGPMKSIENFFLKRKFFKYHRTLCRAIGLVTSYLAVFLIIISLVGGVYFMIGGQISNSSTVANILDTITDYFSNNTLSAGSVQSLINQWNIPFGDFLNDKVGDIANFLTGILTGFLGSIGDFILTIGSNIFSFAISLVLSIYILASYEYFLKLWDKLFFLIFRKSKLGKSVRHSLNIINNTFSKYIHGQLIEAFLVFVLSTIALYIVGIDYAFVIGIICGICNLIPYIGPFVGIVFAGIMALFSGDLWAIVWAVVSLMIVQQIDCNILCPNIVGDIVGLNAAFTLIAISIGGDLAGLLGMLIAVPVAASIKLLVSDWFDRKMKKEYEEYTTNLHSQLDVLNEEMEIREKLEKIEKQKNKQTTKLKKELLKKADKLFEEELSKPENTEAYDNSPVETASFSDTSAKK